MKKILSFILILFSVFLFGSCQGKTENTVDVVTSCYPIYDFTTRIAGDKLVVQNLVKAGVEPHHYEPTTQDIVMLTEAKLFIINGLGLEPYVNTLPASINEKKVEATANIESIDSSKNPGTPDPHMWLDINKAIQMMENIKNYLCIIDSTNSNYYNDNFIKNKYLFEGLNLMFHQELNNLSSKYLVTSHDAFGYLCSAYDLIPIPIRGLSTEDEPTAADINKIIEEVKGKNVTTIFYEDLVSDEIARKIASETGLKCEILYPIEGISKDMASENYLTLMAKNLVQIKKALA